VTKSRVGGVVAFHENDFTYPPAMFPATELSQQVHRWAVPPPGGPGPEVRMGTKLYKVYVDAGLPGPQLMVEAPAGGGPEWPGYEYFVETFRSLLPALQKLTGLDPAQVGIDTLAARLRDEVVRQHGIHMLPIMFGAWARKGG
jgi:hypothetical protein